MAIVGSVGRRSDRLASTHPMVVPIAGIGEKGRALEYENTHVINSRIRHFFSHPLELLVN